MPREGRSWKKGYVYHLYNRRKNRKQLFYCDEDYRFFEMLLERYSAKYEVEIWLYCVMPNHYHVLTYARNVEDYSKVIGMVQRSYGRYFRKKYEYSGDIWSTRFKYEECYYKNRNGILRLARYIFCNPIQSRLCTHLNQYPYSSLKYVSMKGHWTRFSRILSLFDGDEKEQLRHFFTWLHADQNIRNGRDFECYSK